MNKQGVRHAKKNGAGYKSSPACLGIDPKINDPRWMSGIKRDTLKSKSKKRKIPP